MAAVVARHERTLLRVALQSSLCHDDALDAYQRALEIFVRRVGTVDPATEVAWLKVVVRHEAMAIRRARAESVSGEEIELDTVISGPERSVEDQIESGERVRRSAEALRALKPDEAKALIMKAHGLSYEEIGERYGWTYTKVNRVITEGRRRFMRVYEAIEAGEECERFVPIVAALASGAATTAQALQIRPHLRHCTACRASVRELRLSRLRRASLFWPVFVVAERLGGLAPSSPSPEKRVRALVEDGGVPLPQAPDPELTHDGLEPLGRLESLKQEISALFHRANPSDVATGLHIAVSGGGGRIATVAAVLGLCLSSAGVGTVCVLTGVLPGAQRLGLREASEQRDTKEPAQRSRSRRAARSTPERRVQTRPPSGQITTRAPLVSPRRPAAERAAPDDEATPRRRNRSSAGRAAQREFGFEDSTPDREQVVAASATNEPQGAQAATSGPARQEPEPPPQEIDPAQQEFAP